MADDDIRELNALIADYGREFQSPDPRSGPSSASARLYNEDYQPATGSQQAEMLMSLLPGVGEGLDAAHVAQDIGNRDYLGAGLSGLGLVIPGLGAATIKKVGKNLPKHKQGLRSINIDDEDVLKTSEGDPVILYRGINLHDDIEDAALSGKHRGDYATFMSDSPHVADSYARKIDDFFSPRSAIAPFVVKPKKLIEYEDRYTRKNKANPGSAHLFFSVIEFDRAAQKLGPGEVLVVRNVPDAGPAALITGPDDPKYWSYSSDIYATKDSSVLQSPFSAKEDKSGVEEAVKGLSGRFYRGSSNLDELAGKYSLPKEGALGGGGVYVTPDTDYASNYAVQTALGEPKTGGFVAPLNVKFDNPLIIDIKTAQEKAVPELKVLKALGLSDDKAADMLESAYEKTGGLTNQISSRAKKQGFDGIVLRNEDGTIQEAVSYNTKNIRSAFEEVVDESRVSIFPKPERMFDEGSRPRGGEYIDPKTNEALTGKNISSANISVKEGRPAFTGIADDAAEVGSSGKGTFKTKTNLFKKSAGWKWLNGPEEYVDLPTLVSVQQKGKHYYTVDADFPAGVNLTRYADSPSEPRLRPTLQAQPIELGDVIGTISVRGKEHPVYNRIIAKAAGGLVQRNPYNYEPKAI